MRERLPFKDFGRLKLTLTIAMLGFLTDTLISRWMLNSQNGYYESNMMLNPAIGIPLMVLTYVTFDLIIPRKTVFDNVFYTLAIIQWSGPVQNLLVLFNLTNGINFFYALPFIMISSFVVINFKINRESELSISNMNNG
ncbi:MAG: hypothetical protein ABSA11_09570 [Candidatus Bathyarchaeia archaeon]